MQPPHEIALREEPEEGALLVFPSQFTRDWEEAPDPPGKAVVFTFEGPLLNVYATLAVRLAHSRVFSRDAHESRVPDGPIDDGYQSARRVEPSGW